MSMKNWMLLLALPLSGCMGTPRTPEASPVARLSRMDSATVRRLCAKPDSVLGGHASCELRDQRAPIKVF